MHGKFLYTIFNLRSYYAKQARQGMMKNSHQDFFSILINLCDFVEKEQLLKLVILI